MNETPASKSQVRALNLTGNTAHTYREAAATLEAAGYEADGVPAGETWRSAAKMSDADLLSKLGALGPTRAMTAIEIIEVGY